MAKLADSDWFLDLSDYGRPMGRWIANMLKKTTVTPIHVTILFGISGLIAVYFILQNQFLLAGLFIILKSIIDAADGELARLKNTPSYVGRYLDSVFDIILNFLLLIAIGFKTESNLLLIFFAFFCIQLQGTLYNYYYVILRTKSLGGDATSKIFEYKTPRALAGESQKTVDIMFKIYTIVYGGFDKIIHLLDSEAYKVKTFPNWFMTLVSIYGLGFQLLIIAVMLPLGYIKYVLPFFIFSTGILFAIIAIRKVVLAVKK